MNDKNCLCDKGKVIMFRLFGFVLIILSLSVGVSAIESFPYPQSFCEIMETTRSQNALEGVYNFNAGIDSCEYFSDEEWLEAQDPLLNYKGDENFDAWKAAWETDPQFDNKPTSGLFTKASDNQDENIAAWEHELKRQAAPYPEYYGDENFDAWKATWETDRRFADKEGLFQHATEKYVVYWIGNDFETDYEENVIVWLKSDGRTQTIVGIDYENKLYNGELIGFANARPAGDLVDGDSFLVRALDQNNELHTVHLGVEKSNGCTWVPVGDPSDCSAVAPGYEKRFRFKILTIDDSLNWDGIQYLKGAFVLKAKEGGETYKFNFTYYDNSPGNVRLYFEADHELDLRMGYPNGSDSVDLVGPVSSNSDPDTAYWAFKSYINTLGAPSELQWFISNGSSQFDVLALDEQGVEHVVRLSATVANGCAWGPINRAAGCSVAPHKVGRISFNMVSVDSSTDWSHIDGLTGSFVLKGELWEDRNGETYKFNLSYMGPCRHCG